jgi:poly(3-hydroxyalkanoate) depolymerase
MQFANGNVDGQRIRYAVRAGDPARCPLLFFNGLGANIELALPFIEALSDTTVVIFDVPGVGGSPTPRSPYRPAGVARLAAGLLDQLGYDTVDVLGVSWGGAVAQQFAFQHSSRCRRLVLAATSPGSLMVPAHPSVLLTMATPKRYLDLEHAQKVAGEIYGGAFRANPQLVTDTFRHVRFASRGGYFLQLAATVGWTSLPWLFLLKQPTLVMAGADDPIVPLANAHLLQWLIPDARLTVLDCGHLFLVTLAEESACEVESFLAEPSKSDAYPRTAERARSTNPTFRRAGRRAPQRSI